MQMTCKFSSSIGITEEKLRYATIYLPQKAIYLHLSTQKAKVYYLPLIIDFGFLPSNRKVPPTRSQNRLIIMAKEKELFQIFSRETKIFRANDELIKLCSLQE